MSHPVWQKGGGGIAVLLAMVKHEAHHPEQELVHVRAAGHPRSLAQVEEVFGPF